jgi:ribosomal protein S6--L-glutamate ligase
MLQSARGPLVLEVNSSPGLEGIEKATGLDIAGRIIDYTAGLAVRKRGGKGKIKSTKPLTPDSAADV